MSRKNLVPGLNAKMLSANQIAEFLNFNISKNAGDIKTFFLHVGTYLLKLQIDDFRWAWSGIPRHAQRGY